MKPGRKHLSKAPTVALQAEDVPCIVCRANVGHPCWENGKHMPGGQVHTERATSKSALSARLSRRIERAIAQAIGREITPWAK